MNIFDIQQPKTVYKQNSTLNYTIDDTIDLFSRDRVESTYYIYNRMTNITSP